MSDGWTKHPVYHDVMTRESLVGLVRESPADAARRVVVAGPPIGVTWRHPGLVDERSRSLWRDAEKANPSGSPVVTVDPKSMREFFARLVVAVEASNTPERVAAQNLQCRMAARFPAP